MSEPLASWIVLGLTAYLGVGVLFAVVFVTRLVGGIDPDAREGSVGFRLAILPGAAALWPLLIGRALRGTPPSEERSPHRDAACPRPGGAEEVSP